MTSIYRHPYWLINSDTLSVSASCSDIFEKFFVKFQEILSKKVLRKILSISKNLENYSKQFREIFWEN